jgi:hypothetical protein
VVKLGPPASLVIVASHASVPVSALQAKLIPFFEPKTTFPEGFLLPIEWQVSTDVAGFARVDDLPARIRIDVHGEYKKTPIAIEQSPLQLSAGETRLLEIDLRLPIAIRGKAVTPRGDSPGAIKLWVRADRRAASIAADDRRYFTRLDGTRAARAVPTNEQGEFEFTAPAGERLWIGPWASNGSPQILAWI